MVDNALEEASTSLTKARRADQTRKSILQLQTSRRNDHRRARDPARSPHVQFLDRLITVVPRVRDFGASTIKEFRRTGNYSMGVTRTDHLPGNRPRQRSTRSPEWMRPFLTTAKTDAEALAC